MAEGTWRLLGLQSRRSFICEETTKQGVRCSKYARYGFRPADAAPHSASAKVVCETHLPKGNTRP